jgi:enediyne biosynthesis protein E3
MPILHRLLSIDPAEVEFSRRGFACQDPEIRKRLENVGRVFLQGYDVAMRHKNQDALAARLEQIALEHRGFAYEGAAMAITLRERIAFRGNALERFAAGPGRDHIYMLHVGAGWAYARLPWLRSRIERAIRNLHPVFRWLVIDGYGFHQGYFHWNQVSLLNGSIARLSVHARRAFYQGLGRSLWFSNGAQIRAIAAAIARFPALYHEDAWSGVGLACGYAGGVSLDDIVALRRASGKNASALAQGAAFAAKARQRAGNQAGHTETACSVLCAMSADAAAALCDHTFKQIDLFHPCPYQHWRKLVQESLNSSLEIPIRGESHEPAISPSLAVAKSH